MVLAEGETLRSMEQNTEPTNRPTKTHLTDFIFNAKATQQRKKGFSPNSAGELNHSCKAKKTKNQKILLIIQNSKCITDLNVKKNIKLSGKKTHKKRSLGSGGGQIVLSLNTISKIHKRKKTDKFNFIKM